MSIIRNKPLALSVCRRDPRPVRPAEDPPGVACCDPAQALPEDGARLDAALSLAALRRGQDARVVALGGDSGLRHRLQALGLRPGQRVQVLRRAPWGGPIHLQVGMTELMLRRRDAARVAVTAAAAEP